MPQYAAASIVTPTTQKREGNEDGYSNGEGNLVDLSRRLS